MPTIKSVLADIETILKRETARQVDRAARALSAIRKIYTEDEAPKATVQSQATTTAVADATSDYRNRHELAVKTIRRRGALAAKKGIKRVNNPYATDRGGYRTAWFAGYDSAR